MIAQHPCDMDTPAAEKLPQIIDKVDFDYDAVNWLRSNKDEPKTAAEARRTLREILREQSDACRRNELALGRPEFNILYGRPGADSQGTEAFDWFPPRKWPIDAVHLIVYIHGGYWRAIDLPECTNFATPITQSGGIFVAVGYRLAPWQTIHEMPSRLCIALTHIIDYTEKRIEQETHSRLPVKLHLMGHSAGAHLALETVMAGLQARREVNDRWIKALGTMVLIAGIYDVRPMVHTSINTALRLRSADEAWACSPLRLFTDFPKDHFRQISHIDVLFAWAEYDPPALIQQSQDMSKLYAEYSKTYGAQLHIGRVETYCAKYEDHFTTITNLNNGTSSSALLKKILEFIGLL